MANKILKNDIFFWVPLGITTFSLFLLNFQNGLFSDDLVNFAIAKHMGLSIEYLNRDVFGHWIPAKRMLDYFLGSFVPISWILMLATMVLFVAFSAILFRKYAYYLGFSTVLTNLIAAFLPVTGAITGTVIWYSGSAQPLPGMTFGLLSLCLINSYVSTHKLIKLAVSSVSAFIGLLFDERTLVFLGLGIILTYIFRHKSISTRTSWIIGSFISFVVISWFVLLRIISNEVIHPEISDVVSALKYSFLGLLGNFVPNILGVSSTILKQEFLLAYVPFVVAITSLLVLVSFLILIKRKNHKSLLALFLIAISVLLVFFVTGQQRVTDFGYSSALEPRYSAIFMPFGLLTILLLARNSQQQRTIYFHEIVAGIIYFIVALSCATFQHAYANQQLLKFWDGIVALKPGTQILDATVPEHIVPSVFFPYNQLRTLIPLFNRNISIGEVPEAKYFLSRDGEIATYEIVPGHGDQQIWVHTDSAKQAEACITNTELNYSKSDNESDVFLNLKFSKTNAPYKIEILTKASAKGIEYSATDGFKPLNNDHELTVRIPIREPHNIIVKTNENKDYCLIGAEIYRLESK